MRFWIIFIHRIRQDWSTSCVTDLGSFLNGLFIFAALSGGIRKRRRDREKLRKLTESFRVYFHVVVFFISKRTVICPCIGQHWWFMSGVLRIWAICVWLPVPLYGVVAVLCHRHLRGSVVFEPWGTFDYLIFRACILWSYRTLFLDSLESRWLDNARCELKISLWAWSSCVDLYRPFFCLDSGKVIMLLGLVNSFTDYFD